MEKHEEELKVRGHMCENLKHLQNYNEDSHIPYISEDGCLSSISGVNNWPISHCPCCGEELLKTKKYECTCLDCGNTWETIDSSDRNTCRKCFKHSIVSMEVDEIEGSNNFISSSAQIVVQDKESLNEIIKNLKYIKEVFNKEGIDDNSLFEEIDRVYNACMQNSIKTNNNEII